MHFGNIDKIYAGTDSVSKVFLGTDLIWPYTPPVPPTPVSGDYLTMQIVSGGTINWKTNNSANAKTISYSINSGPWANITSSIGGTSFNVNSGDTILFKGENNSYSGNTFTDSTAYFNLSGNIMSLVYGDNYSGQTALTDVQNFMSLLAYTNVVNAGGLSLPATTLRYACYYYMFRNCTSLTTAPVLPATSLNNCDFCYAGMFSGCTSLRTAPELPATILEADCYSSMFRGCTSLRTAPALPATSLEMTCYANMFRDCTSLTTAPVLPATSLVTGCYNNMFDGCTSLNYIKCLATSSLPISDSYSSYWVRNVASSGTFVKAASMTNWLAGDSGIPSGWTIIDNQ